MKPEQPLISIQQAEVLIQESLHPLTPACVPLAQAANRVLREAVIAERQQPPFDRVMMDGIAIDSTAVDEGHSAFTIAGTQAAGQAPMALPAKTSCIEIMTGAVLPVGCDCVIPVERISIQEGKAILEEGLLVNSRQHIHPQGSDYPKAKILLHAGGLIRPPEVAVIASSGMAEVQVSPLLSAGIISPGDELIQPGEPIAEHQIRRSNDVAVAAAIECRGDLTAHCYPVADNPDVVATHIKKVLAENDVLILCGAVSKGKFDFVPDVLVDCGVKKVFHRIAQRPGKPFWFGVAANGKPVFALPGNPVSVLACTARYLQFAIDILRGSISSSGHRLPLAQALEFKPPLGWLLAVHLDTGPSGELQAIPQITNTSGDFAGLSGADGIVELPAHQQQFPAGYRAQFYPWGGLR